MMLETEARRRLAGADWDAITAELDDVGAALMPDLLTPRECSELRALYARDDCFRSTVTMQRHGYGRGEYRYFSYPLPDLVGTLRNAAWAPLARIANRWNAALGLEQRFPAEHAAWLQLCHAAGQRRPTPLLLRYEAGDYNCLHQDLYGEHVFPLQMTVLLSDAGRDFSGGEFVLSEQRPRRQSRPHVVPLGLGDAVIFAVRQRPAAGPRGVHRVTMRHGVSKVRSGLRFTLGVIFHDAA